MASILHQKQVKNWSKIKSIVTDYAYYDFVSISSALPRGKADQKHGRGSGVHTYSFPSTEPDQQLTAQNVLPRSTSCKTYSVRVRPAHRGRSEWGGWLHHPPRSEGPNNEQREALERRSSRCNPDVFRALQACPGAGFSLLPDAQLRCTARLCRSNQRRVVSLIDALQAPVATLRGSVTE
jgi:hypothetical protein